MGLDLLTTALTPSLALDTSLSPHVFHFTTPWLTIVFFPLSLCVFFLYLFFVS